MAQSVLSTEKSLKVIGYQLMKKCPPIYRLDNFDYLRTRAEVCIYYETRAPFFVLAFWLIDLDDSTSPA